MIKLPMKKRILLLSIIVFVILSATIGITIAWLSKEHQVISNIIIGDITQGISVDFDGTSGDEFYNSELDLLETDATKGNNNDNDISKLNVNLVFTPEVAIYFRVKICTEWYVTRTYNNVDKVINEVSSQEGVEGRLNYIVDSYVSGATDNKWVYDYNTGYMYYKEIIPAGTTTTITFITEGEQYATVNNRVYSETCVGYIDLILESVQVNRYEEVWGFDPFE